MPARGGRGSSSTRLRSNKMPRKTRPVGYTTGTVKGPGGYRTDARRSRVSRDYLKTMTQWRLFGHDIRFARTRMIRLWQFIASCIMLVELAFAAWPVTAIVLWGFVSVYSWPFLLYAIRALLLLYGILRVEYVYWMLGSGKFSKYSLVRVWGAFTPYSSMKIWAGIAIFAGLFFGILLVVFNAAAYPLYDSSHRLVWAINLAVSVVAVVESYFAPIWLYCYGVKNTTKAAVQIAKRRRASV